MGGELSRPLPAALAKSELGKLLTGEFERSELGRLLPAAAQKNTAFCTPVKGRLAGQRLQEAGKAEDGKWACKLAYGQRKLSCH